MRENHQMANRNCTVRMCLHNVIRRFLTLKGNICLLEMTIGPSNDRASPGTSLQRNGAAMQGERVHEAPNK